MPGRCSIGAVVYCRGVHFKGSRRLDEIGELSRALERIMRRLDAHVGFIETFRGDVVHELKNPLASIRNANEMIADVSDPADRRRFVRVIEQEVARMERLLSGVREITTIDARLATRATRGSRSRRAAHEDRRRISIARGRARALSARHRAGTAHSSTRRRIG